MTAEIRTADAFDSLADMDAESVHAVVTDPPYGLAFMGRDWDTFDPKEYQEWCEEWASLALDVLKPGGHLLAFSGNRTHHRLFSGVEDAGFEVRDTLTWHYGSGFPKALDVSKAIDKAADAEREVVGVRTDGVGNTERSLHKREGLAASRGETFDLTAPATDAAREWDGWKTALKPATEFIVLARKPFEGTVAENVQAHGTGALNIDGCRVGTEERENPPQGTADGVDYGTKVYDGGVVEGRYPANVVFDAEVAGRLDREVGDLDAGARTPQTSTGRNTSDAPTRNDPDERLETDSGGPSRYFYTSKATRAERTLDGKIENAHPTVKPIDLMEWLVRLVTAERQLVLDPFCGTGTTLRAAKNLDRQFIGIEQSPEWADVARARCGLTPDDPEILTDDNQSGLNAYADGGDPE